MLSRWNCEYSGGFMSGDSAYWAILYYEIQLPPPWPNNSPNLYFSGQMKYFFQSLFHHFTWLKLDITVDLWSLDEPFEILFINFVNPVL